jgi:thymidine kinase
MLSWALRAGLAQATAAATPPARALPSLRAWHAASRRRAASAALSAAAAAAEPAQQRAEPPALPPWAAPRGHIELILGPMFAGKSSALLARVAAAEAAGLAVAVVTSSRDGRYGRAAVATHDGARRAAHAAPTLAAFRAAAGEAAYSSYDLIAVDEAQFFPDLVEFCAAAADVDGKRLVLAGLDGDFRRRRFGGALDNVPLADAVTKHAGACRFCAAEATAANGDGGDASAHAHVPAPAVFSLRLGGGEDPVEVGGAEAYAPVCRRHYIEHAGGGAD